MFALVIRLVRCDDGSRQSPHFVWACNRQPIWYYGFSNLSIWKISFCWLEAVFVVVVVVMINCHAIGGTIKLPGSLSNKCGLVCNFMENDAKVKN